VTADRNMVRAVVNDIRLAQTAEEGEAYLTQYLNFVARDDTNN